MIRQHNRNPRHVTQLLRTKAVWVVAFAVVGSGLVLLTKAAIPTASTEAELGTAQQGATSVLDTTGSNGLSIKFATGATKIPPARLRAYSGGDSIALRWEPVSPTLNPVKYHVFRNGAEISAITIASAIQYVYENKGTSYFDFAVTPGGTYNYQVQAELADGSRTTMSNSAQVTAPTNTTPVPNVTIQYNGLSQAQFANYVSEAKTTLRVWYPKAVDLLVNNGYGVSNNITISIIDHTKGCLYYGGWASGDNTFSVCDSFVLDAPNDMSIIVHEVTHNIQNYVYNNTSHMISEGIASWMSDLSTGYTQAKPTQPYTYDDGYGYASYFFTWIMNTYNIPSLPHDMNVATHNNTADAPTVMKQKTGKTVGQLWTQLIGSYVSSLGPIRGAAGTCVKPVTGDVGALLTTFGCDTQPFYQNVTYIAKPDQPSVGLIKFGFDGLCIRTKNDSTAYAAYVVNGSCDFNSSTALWQQASDGSLRNVGANLCLQPSAGVTTDGTNMLIAACDNVSTTATRRWALPGA